MAGLDISTVSRGKQQICVDTPYGTKLIKEFSVSHENDQGEDVSTLEQENLQNTKLV
jgi:RNA polymerase sigma-54 factor